LEERLAGRHQLEDAFLALDPEVILDAAPFGDEAHQRRSRAWMPVFSSVLMTWPPSSRRRGATPRHASWLNQVEIWFSILARRALKRASFKSLEALQQRLVDFIDYFNAVLAKPFRWTYAGKPLRAA
jgi:hypothetical protein